MLSGWMKCLMETPLLLPALALVACAILVNGATDAPNAIASAVGSGAISFSRACALAAVCNLLGVAGAGLLAPAVARTIQSAAAFSAGAGAALAGVCAALLTVVLWALLAWRFGIPTSESHALAAALAGAALAMPEGGAGLRPGPWIRIGLGMAVSILLGLALGRLAARLLAGRVLGEAFCRRAQIAGAAVMALLHGAQDGQKFLGVLLLAVSLTDTEGMSAGILQGAPAACALCMALGTAAGGRRIVNMVGQRLVRLSPHTGFAADLGGAAALALCTLAGFPVSTTHTRTAAILGAGSAGGTRPDRQAARSILWAWLLTIPACGAAGYGTARLLLHWAGAL